MIEPKPVNINAMAPDFAAKSHFHWTCVFLPGIDCKRLGRGLPPCRTHEFHGQSSPNTRIVEHLREELAIPKNYRTSPGLV